MRPDLNDLNQNKGLVDLGSIPGVSPVASFNLDAIDNLIRTKGFLCFHYKHALNPDKESLGGPTDPNKQSTHRAYRYYEPRPVYHVPRNYKLEDQLTTQAVFQQGSVLVNLNGKYEDSIPDKSDIAFVRPNDILVFPSLTDMTQQLFRYDPNCKQKLHYKIKDIDILFDMDYNYKKDVDFSISKDGELVWLNGKRPKGGVGSVISVTYYFTPLYIVSAMLHSLRVLPSNEQGHAAYPREATYAPQQFVCKSSVAMEEKDLLNYQDLPPLPMWDDGNTGGGSF